MQNTWWIGRSCKRREAFRRAVLIGRALAPILPEREGGAWNGWILRFGRHAALRVPGFRRAGESALHERDHRGGDHPIPFRTRQLSSPSSMILRTLTWESRTTPRLYFQRAVLSRRPFVLPEAHPHHGPPLPKPQARRKPLLLFLHLPPASFSYGTRPVRSIIGSFASSPPFVFT